MWARLAALLMFFGFVMTFAPQFVMGYEGMPRRYHVYPQVFQPLMVMSSVGASVLAVAYVLPMFYLFWSLRYGKPAGPNPWGATGLEWTTPSPPPKDNFETTPIVDKEAYCYPEQGRAAAPQTQQAEAADA
jgi:cytochrome c oxidase subunit 1